MKATVKRDDLVSYERMAEIIADVVDSNDPRQLLRRWKAREFIKPVRPDLIVFEWSEVRPILAERLNQPPDAWADEPAYVPDE